MRPQQQNRRMRGRNNNNNNNNNSNNNNRKGPNPLTRTYESNGPDVKIRGSAQQIAEKYATLARDAQSSGDRVMAENYLQHAEHYNRIIAAAQAQMPVQHQQQPSRDDFDEDFDDDREEGEAQPATGDQPVLNHGAGPQPVIEGTPAEVALNNDIQPRENNGYRQNNNGRHRERGNGGRHENRRPYGGDQPRQDEQQPLAAQDRPPLPVAEQEAATEAVSDETAGQHAAAPAEEAAPRPRRGRRPRRPAADEGAGADAPAQDAPLAAIEG